MTRRRNNSRKGTYNKKRFYGKRQHKSGRRTKSRNFSSALEDNFLAFMHKLKAPVSLTEISEWADGEGGLSRKDIKPLIENLCRNKVLQCVSGRKKDKLYSLHSIGDLAEGTVEMHPRGFGFAILDDGKKGINATSKDKAARNDPFIPPDSLKTAHQGDRVLFRLTSRKRGRMEARVVSVIERASNLFAGIYDAGRVTGFVVPEDERFAFKILIRKEKSSGAKNGDAVVAQVTDFVTGQRNPEGRIVEVLGNPEDINVQTELVIRKFSLPHIFTNEALQQANELPAEAGPGPGRADLRDILHVTIDGETARDFDDAVAIEKTDKGYRLHVSIADVSHYVQQGATLDKEAYQRGTSVYFPNKVVPMLPERLSNNLCSLVPGEDRHAFTAVLDFSRTGKRVGKKFTKSVIKSRYRLTYTIVRKILVDRDSGLRKDYEPILGPLELMAELAAGLEKQRMDRGSIGFSIPEAAVTISQEGKVDSISRQERNLAHKMIEEFMLAANEAVAETFTQKKQELVYRIHELPDAEKVQNFTEFAQTLELSLPSDTGTPHWFGSVLAMVEGTPKEYIVNNLLLRTMQRARYSPENVGHFGLAATDYTHFTSPIRRYPDLMVHRALAELVKSPGVSAKVKKSSIHEKTYANLEEAGGFLSGREKIAADAEREMTDRLKVMYMKDKIGDVFEGVISGVTSFGLFIELLDCFVSGAVAMDAMNDDYYIYDARHHRLVGELKGKTFQTGDVVKVRVASVEVRKRHVNFTIEEQIDSK